MNQSSRPRARKLTAIPLIAATYFMVSGGPYGLEEIIQKTGFSTAILVLLITPLIWSLPTALMIGELSSAIPEEGGFYVWVRRALGPFWGFQEAWLSLIASVFDMAIYPTIFVLYLSRLWPWAAEKTHGVIVATALIVICTAWNLRGARAVGRASVVMTIALLAPFGLMMVYAFLRAKSGTHAAAVSSAPTDLLGGIMIATWNYMGWDNASTVAGEVENPQKTYPLAILGAVALVALTYILPVAAIGRTGLDPSNWDTGSWVEAATALAGPWLGACITIGGMICGAGMFNALIMSYSRLPMVMAEDGYLPNLFTRKIASNGAPWVALVSCAVAWTVSLGLSFERLILIDVMLYGLSLILEFVALVVLRIREPELVRPFRVPGGIVGAVILSILPTSLIAVALVRNHTEQIGDFSALNVGLIMIGFGIPIYLLGRQHRRRVESRVRLAATAGD